MDEYGEFIGLVTLEDLLEEIVGDIDDETDEGHIKYEIRPLGDGERWQAHGLASLADVQRATGLVVPADLGANTLSGLFMQRLGRMPAVGDQVTEHEYRLIVEAMKDNRVDQVGIEKLSPEEVIALAEDPAPGSGAASEKPRRADRSG